MKKIICLLIFVFLGSPSFAYQLDWNEFCPPQYVNAKYMRNDTISRWKGFLYGITIVGLPVTANNIDRYHEIEVNNYWVDRRLNFYTKITNCKKIANKAEMLYEYSTIEQEERNSNDDLQKKELQPENLLIKYIK